MAAFGSAARRTQQIRTLGAADLATFFNGPEPRIQNRLRALADQGRIQDSGAAPDRWMIVLLSDPTNTGRASAANRLAFVIRVEGWQSG